MGRMTKTAETLDLQAATAAPVLSVRDLETAFRTREGWLPIVKGISFDIAPRRRSAVVGESGSGKSVTALSIMRLLSPEAAAIEGSVRLDGRELLTLPEPEMRADPRPRDRA